MAETELELQLQVWKDLAVSKQILIRAATDALKLDPNCSQDELKEALTAAIKRSIEADVDVSKAQEQAKVAIATVEKQLQTTQKARDLAEAASAEALATQEKLQQQLADERSRNAKEVSTLKERLAEKERALKAINTALADTPENVVKKLKALKRQKMDESEARKRAEETATTLRKDKQKLEQRLKDQEAALQNAVQLSASHRELHTLCGTLRTQLEPLVEDAASLPAVPDLDAAVLESIEKAGAAEEQPGRQRQTA